MNVLVVVAHPDDEVLGCGGTIARHISEGDKVSVVTMTDGVSARKIAGSADVDRREDAFEKSCKNLGVTHTKKYQFPDNKMDAVPLLDIVKKIEEEIIEFRPSLIYTHFPYDLNIDHQLVSKATVTACRPQPTAIVEEIRFFEVVSSTHWNYGTNFEPNLYINITSFSECKKASLSLYEEEMRPWPHQRSCQAIEALEKFRGSTVGVDKAEAFVVMRKIIR
jgi:N-acetylglucosamine malate deacetylase 1